MLAEAGLVGRGPGKYNLYLGGNTAGTRIPKLYLDNVAEAEILATLDQLIGRWSLERNAGECFGDFVIRVGVVAEVKVRQNRLPRLVGLQRNPWSMTSRISFRCKVGASSMQAQSKVNYE
ncbi:MAG: hypothetical protein U5L01_06925 [Rheinheimera sp.]|nr:hypothetical protein [Rheinheimera sp.]